jgi:hypothetical protein
MPVNQTLFVFRAQSRTHRGRAKGTKGAVIRHGLAQGEAKGEREPKEQRQEEVSDGDLFICINSRIIATIIIITVAI